MDVIIIKRETMSIKYGYSITDWNKAKEEMRQILIREMEIGTATIFARRCQVQ